ncbi:hypothetical protein [Pedobacter montanisoli]|uniref:Uncharacterized protein n=1 Tax=Pedobacter montanisoli TaxID=2923277 RepID=A0ABS9ZZ11_9SPHI|nr:hypothetical protein [Pedobacter montanisoli]MCJ0743543.1 hypothetical protein [Pedobacter montanisoli]
MRKFLFILLVLTNLYSISYSQQLKLKKSKSQLSATTFSEQIADTTRSLLNREETIYRAIAQGNIPDYLRKLVKISITDTLANKPYTLDIFVLPDYLSIGTNEDYLYMPVTPILAQKIANLSHCSLPTKKLVDLIYQHAKIKLEPQPIPPTKAMTTVAVFEKHNLLVQDQLFGFNKAHLNGLLTAGNKKDIIISNKIYGENSPRVVIYGWHKTDSKPIQPVYNKHSNTWADYSHGLRLVQNKVYLNGKSTTLQKILADPVLSKLISDEGSIEKPFYPIFEKY